MTEKLLRLQTVNPATGEIIGEYDQISDQAIHSIVKDAAKAQPQWAAKSVEERATYLRKVQKYLLENVEQTALTISRNNGKTRNDALIGEVIPAIIAVNYYCKKTASFLKPEKLKPGSLLLANKRSVINKIPYGVIGIISPWNYPFAIPFSEVVAALLAGNTVVLKVAAESLAVGQMLADIFKQADLPKNVFNYIVAPGATAGKALLAGGINKLFFTGSVPVGKILMAEAAATLTPLVLELGGNDAMIVADDANLDRAATGAVWGGFSNAGQSCAGIERIYVHEAVYDAFVDKLSVLVKSLHSGNGEDLLTDLTVMTKLSQKKVVEKQIQDALAKGARICAQSPAPDNVPENFHPATVLVDVTHDMEIMQEETFGPVLAVMKVRDMDEAIRLANDSQYGLTGSIWTKNQKNGAQLAARLSAGVITLNDHLISHGMPETPWGGFRESGIGRTHGKLGFEEMVQHQVVVKDLLHFTKSNLWWHPYGPELYRGLLAIPQSLFGEKLKIRLKAYWTLLKTLRRMFK